MKGLIATFCLAVGLAFFAGCGKSDKEAEAPQYKITGGAAVDQSARPAARGLGGGSVAPPKGGGNPGNK